jgi:hypothetical protein
VYWDVAVLLLALGVARGRVVLGLERLCGTAVSFALRAADVGGWMMIGVGVGVGRMTG